jgi:hypothetical protein
MRRLACTRCRGGGNLALKIPQPPLSELRVVEISPGDALGYCGKPFADFGADLISQFSAAPSAQLARAFKGPEPRERNVPEGFENIRLRRKAFDKSA